MMGLRSMICNANDFSNDEKAGFPTLSRRWAVSPRMGDIPARPGDFCNVKGQREIQFTLASECQRSPIAMQQWGFKHEKSRERKKGCHLWMASFLRFIAANLSLTHAVTAVSPR